MADYNGSAQDYLDQKRAQHARRLREIWNWAVNVTEQGNTDIAKSAEQFKTARSSHLDEQQQIDQQLEDHMESLYDRQMAMQQETDQVYDRMQGILDELLEPFEVEVGGGTESDRAQLERLYQM